MKYPGGHAKIQQKSRRRKFTQRNCEKTSPKKLKALPGKHFITKKDTGIFKINWY